MSSAHFAAPIEYEELRPRLVRFCAGMTGSLDAAEDLAQDALMTELLDPDRIREARNPEAWLFGVARNLCLRWRTSRPATRSAGNEALSALPDPSPDIEQILERDELMAMVAVALEGLPVRDREVLRLRYLGEMGTEEMSVWLEISPNAVGQRLHRARASLRRHLVANIPEEAAALGLLSQTAEIWQSSRMWCPSCGAIRLRVRLELDRFTASCPGCGTTTTSCLPASGKPLGFWRTMGSRERGGGTILRRGDRTRRGCLWRMPIHCCHPAGPSRARWHVSRGSAPLLCLRHDVYAAALRSCPDPSRGHEPLASGQAHACAACERRCIWR